LKIDVSHGGIPGVDGRAEVPGRGPARAGRDVGPGDALEISDRAKAASRETAPSGAGRAGGDLTSTLNQVRSRLHERVRSCFYDSDEVLESVAREILNRLGL
jgi:hypothetical protein